MPFHPKAKHLYRSAQDECTAQSTRYKKPSEIENRLFSLIQEILYIGRISGFSTHQWTKFYQKIADDLGLKLKTRVDHSGVREIVEKQWNKTEIGSLILNQGSDDWLVQLFRKHRRSFHPLRHLIVWCSLLPNMEAKQIFQILVQTETGASKEESSTTTVSQTDYSVVSEYRRLWQEILLGNPDRGIKAIRSVKPGCAVYAWLYRNDRSWLMSHRPPRVKIDNHHLRNKSTWDCEILCSLKQVYKREFTRSKRPRLSRTFLINQIPRSNSVAKHINNLPQSSNWLNKNAESIEEYQLHRVFEAVSFLEAKELPIKRWRILKAAGIRFHSVPSSVELIIRKIESRKSNKWK